MFEKEAEEYDKKVFVKDFEYHYEIQEAYKDGAEFGYNKAKVEVEDSYREYLCNSELNLASVTEQLEELEKANEWHYVKDEGIPTKEGHYLVCLRNKDHDVFDCWIFVSDNVSYSLKVRMKDIYAWKEIVLPKEIE